MAEIKRMRKIRMLITSVRVKIQLLLFIFIKHYLFSVLVSHILQTKIFLTKIKINIPRKIDYLHRVLQKYFFFIYIYIYICTYIHSNF